MLEDDIHEVQNLLERKKNYELCIKHLNPYNGLKVITNYKTGQNEAISARIFATISRYETGKMAFLDEKAEALLLPIFKQLLDEVNKEIALVEVNGVPNKHVKTMLSEEIQPMFKEPLKEEKENVNPSAWVKWGVAIVIGIVLLLLLNIM